MPKKKPVSKSTAALRIIGGQWRGRKLAIADIEGLRPTGDRLRETLFNWLQQDIRGARCLDCFAGSGALGFEALSRGAQSVTLIEKHPKAIASLRDHCQLLGVDTSQCDVVQGEMVSWLATANLAPASVDIVFIDPPFAADLWQAVFDALNQSQCLAEGALIYVEAPKNLSLSLPAHWQIHREKTAGDVGYCLLRHLTLGD